MFRSLRLLAISVLLGMATPSLACPVCISAPERGAAQRLIEDDFVVLARPSEENLFRFQVVEILRGDAAAIEAAPEIPFLVPSVLRRQMASDASLWAVVSYGPPEPDTANPGFLGNVGQRVWTLIAVVQPESRRIIEEITKAPGWGVPRPGTSDAPRFEYFANMHAHPDLRLRTIAWRELRTWPYERLRRIPLDLTASELRAILVDKNAIPDQPLAILLLANHNSDEARAATRSGAQNALSGGSDLTLGAWVVGLLELEGEDAIQPVANKILWPADVTDRRRQAALTGLITAADALPELRAPVAATLAETARLHPDLLAETAAALMNWRDGQLAADVAAALDARDSRLPAEEFLLRRYRAAFNSDN